MTVLDLLGVAWLLLVMLLVAAIASATRARRPRGRHVRMSHRLVEAVERGHLEPVVDHESGDVTYRITEAGRAHLDARLGYDT